MKFFVSALITLLILITIEVLKVYFIMPFPGSQQETAVTIAYAMHTKIWLLRIAGYLLLFYFVYKALPIKTWAKVLGFIVLCFYGLVFYMFNFKFLADKMFYKPETKYMATAAQNKIPLNQLVLGIEINGVAKAYPIEIIGYHHQIEDSIGNTPILVTYCTVCRTGRIYSPIVNGKNESFRLVGMDNFNAMFEDKTTGSWWRQVSGEAIAGKLKGTQLNVLFSVQTTLQAWQETYPNTLVLQPDPKFTEKYKELEGYAYGTIKDNGLEGTDSSSWGKKSWVVGISIGNAARAYDWNGLLKKKAINDTLNGTPVLLVVLNDGQTFKAWNREVEGQLLTFKPHIAPNEYIDTETQSVWSATGICKEGVNKGKRLQPIQAYQEFWRSWQTFQPQTTKY